MSGRLPHSQRNGQIATVMACTLVHIWRLLSGGIAASGADAACERWLDRRSTTTAGIGDFDQ